ncbi:MAG TPA: TonB-dependent receptor [Ignavibacteriales bacterium]|nr:TonB-dependent receptor [Ignavibacteriales bacterium]
MKKLLLLGILSLQIFSLQVMAQVGKISGVVRDASTSEVLIGANVLIEGTTIGAATNVEGYYVILNVPPGSYNLRASMVGYAPKVIQQVRVSIDQTTEINFELTSDAIQTEEVVVVATTPIVQRDVSSSRVNLNVAEIENLPVSSLSGVIGLQAGVRSGLEIRGGSANQTAFLVNGVTLRDERDNSPFTGISYTAVDEVQIQTGGFNAEHGNIRSGLVNVVTKDGPRDKYTFSLISRYSSASQKHFGSSPNHPNSYWIRPYLDPQVAWFGTKANDPNTGLPIWDSYTQQQYPEFEGWVSVAAKTLLDSDPTNDITPEQAQKIFLWQHRKITDIQDPDYDVDASFGGPVPFAKDLGNLRFFASYRQTQSMYVVPLSRDGVNDWLGQLKLTADVGEGKKLMVQGLISKSEGTNNNNAGLPGVFRSPESIGDVMNRVSYISARIFATDYWAPSNIDRNSFGGKFTHVIDPTSLYEITLSTFQSKYSTNPGRLRDTTTLYDIGGVYIDEAPFGFADFPSTGIDGLRMGVGFSNSRDSSVVTSYSFKGDFQSQIDKYNNVKTGIEIVYTDNRVNYASVDKFLPSGRSRSVWSNFPIRGALYVQNKLEFEGMVANLGLRLDYSDPQGSWYEYDSYNKAFASENSLGLDTLLKKITVDKQIYLSPRVGISFPISINSKLYFNYGHFRQMPTPENLFLLRRFSDNNAVTRIADPNNPLPRTISYELGYEQNLFDQLLVKLAGYYKDVSLQSRLVTYQSRDNKVNYSKTEPNNYQDVRGFELTMTKNRGDWVQGFINYTYDVRSEGNFGFGTYYENASLQRSYEATTTSTYQEKPIPRPFANANIDIFTPSDFGPQLGSIHILGDFRFGFTANWYSGRYTTWAGGGSIPGIENNVQWRDFWNVDLRISKSFHIMGVNLQIFADITNLFNYKYMHPDGYGFVDGNDYIAYMKSLHLPAEIGDPLGYGNIPGEDQPGDYRTGPYIPWDPNASDSQKEEWKENKSYIDMPNQEYFTFLNPRDVFLGLKLSFDF